MMVWKQTPPTFNNTSSFKRQSLLFPELISTLTSERSRHVKETIPYSGITQIMGPFNMDLKKSGVVANRSIFTNRPTLKEINN